MARFSRLLLLVATATSAGCSWLAAGSSYVIQDVAHALVDEKGPPGTVGPNGGAPREGSPGPLFQEEQPETTVSQVQYAPTLDWRMGIGPLPYAPGRSIFESMAGRRMPCQSVPVGLAQVFSGPTGPAASPITRWGPLEVGVAGPEGAIGTLTAWNSNTLSARALSSGARMASAGSTCSMRIFFYLRIGRTDDAISVLR